MSINILLLKLKTKQIRQLLNSSGAQEDNYLSTLITHVIGDKIDQLDYLEAREVFDLPLVKVKNFGVFMNYFLM